MSNTAEALTQRNIDAATVRDATRGQWTTILPTLIPLVDYPRDGHGPCPGCGLGTASVMTIPTNNEGATNA